MIIKPYFIVPTSFKQAKQVDEMFGMIFNYLNKIDSLSPRNLRHIVVPSFGIDEAVAIGDGTFGLTVPEELDRYTLIEALSSMYIISTSGNITIVLRHARAGTDSDLGTLTILANAYYGTVKLSKAVSKGDIILVDVDAVGTGMKGLFTVFTFEGK